MSAPEPFVPPHADVHDLDGFMLNVERLLASELVAIGTPEECWAAFMLWCRAWKQLPGGSLPNDDRVLASFSGAGKRWQKVREVALHGFILCSDGRLYHRFLCAEVLRAYERKVAYQKRRDTDRKRLLEWRAKQNRHDDETPDETRFVAEDTIRYGSSSVGSNEPPAGTPANLDPIKAIFDRGVGVFTKAGVSESQARSLIGKWRRDAGEPAVMAAIIDCETESPTDLVPFFVKCVERHQKPRAKVYSGGVIPMHPGAGG